MTAREDEDREVERLVETRLLRVNALTFGIVAGLVSGLGLFVATNWLVLKGGMHGQGHAHDVGPHLSLLAQYFIGYSVTFAGSLVGFLWAFACGLAVGYVGSWLYNAVAHLRHQRRAP
jgi:hypothetical protein